MPASMAISSRTALSKYKLKSMQSNAAEARRTDMCMEREAMDKRYQSTHNILLRFDNALVRLANDSSTVVRLKSVFKEN